MPICPYDPGDLAVLVAQLYRSGEVESATRPSIRFRYDCDERTVAIEVWCGGYRPLPGTASMQPEVYGGVRVAAFDCQPVRMPLGVLWYLTEAIDSSVAIVKTPSMNPSGLLGRALESAGCPPTIPPGAATPCPPCLYVCLVAFPQGEEYVAIDSKGVIAASDPGDDATREKVVERLESRAKAAFPSVAAWRIATFGLASEGTEEPVPA